MDSLAIAIDFLFGDDHGWANVGKKEAWLRTEELTGNIPHWLRLRPV